LVCAGSCRIGKMKNQTGEEARKEASHQSELDLVPAADLPQVGDRFLAGAWLTKG
jgi:hypothetical protein